ncbi:U6 snRNA-associated Sm-like protein LSm2 [Cyphellophora attinorum]|uniref:U6 snRNA-associated Sm-like protein LSm2 n=1 Tax=Cyphellophora attinorum TaxID=1664694 RepID=A0A0N1P225_9EURO|nr:U6 snRNA-associated Sm-like protein LSm2 [Phialophora attinorum]KPI45340.1 U6 snRNA-associated Sm-like protein LSm2 [Phialophora attinorum]
MSNANSHSDIASIGPPPPYGAQLPPPAASAAYSHPTHQAHPMPHQLPWSTRYPHPQPPLSVPPEVQATGIYSSPMPPPSTHFRNHSQDGSSLQQMLEHPYHSSQPPPPHQRLPSNYPPTPPTQSPQPYAEQQYHQQSCMMQPPPQQQQIRFIGPSAKSLLSSSKASISYLPSTGPNAQPQPSFDLKTSKHTKPHITLTRIRADGASDQALATASWSSLSGSMTLQLWPATAQATELKLSTDWNSLLGDRRIEGVLPWHNGQGQMRWAVEENSIGVHLLKGGGGSIMAKWDASGSASTSDSQAVGGSEGHGRSGSGSGIGMSSLGLGDGSSRGLRESLGLTSSALLGTSTYSGSNGGGGSGGWKAQLGMADPVLTILGAPPGVSINDQRWIEFVVASGVCVLKREEKDVKDVLKVLGKINYRTTTDLRPINVPFHPSPSVQRKTTTTTTTPLHLNFTYILATLLPPPSPTFTMLFFSFFKTLTNTTLTVELKNDISIRGTLKSVDQYLNIKLDDIVVLDELKYPHLSSVKNIFIRGSVVRYVHLPVDKVDRGLLEDATRREAENAARGKA